MLFAIISFIKLITTYLLWEIMYDIYQRTHVYECMWAHELPWLPFLLYSKLKITGIKAGRAILAGKPAQGEGGKLLYKVFSFVF